MTDAGTSLTEDELEMLAMERLWWKYAGLKEQRVRERFGISMTRYYQLLNDLVDRPDALAHDPILIHRLQRIRARFSRSRRVG